MKRSVKIDICGTDGAGKTTGLKYFIGKAQEAGLSVVETREVGNPHIPACVKMREFVLDPASNLAGESMELIFSAMRIENDRWLEKLNNSENPPNLVVSDRGWFSHLAYTDHNVDENFTKKLYINLIGRITAMPDVVIYFDVNTDTALKRRVKRGEGMDVIEMKGVEFQEKVRDSFIKHMAFTQAHQPDMKFFTVDANDSLEGVQNQLNLSLAQLI